MPASLSADVAHTEVTDHRILRRPAPAASPAAASNALPALTPFPPSEEARRDLRDLALAWQSIVDSGMSKAGPQAEQLLRSALREFPLDPALLTALGYAVQRRGDDVEARALYEKALEVDPTLVDAATNLGVLEAQQGRMNEAIKLWKPAFERAPARSEIGMNLARAYCGAAQFGAAHDSVERVLRFNPDLGAAKKLFGELNADPPRCTP